MAGCSSAITIFPASYIGNYFGKSDEIKIYEPLTLLGCFSSGLVSISASCRNVTIWSSLIIGAIGTIFFVLAKKIFNRLEIDDPIN